MARSTERLPIDQRAYSLVGALLRQTFNCVCSVRSPVRLCFFSSEARPGDFMARALACAGPRFGRDDAASSILGDRRGKRRSPRSLRRAAAAGNRRRHRRLADVDCRGRIVGSRCSSACCCVDSRSLAELASAGSTRRGVDRRPSVDRLAKRILAAPAAARNRVDRRISPHTDLHANTLHHAERGSRRSIRVDHDNVEHAGTARAVLGHATRAGDGKGRR